MPLHQHTLSAAIDKANFNRLLASAPSFQSCALALSSNLPHAGDWLNVVPSEHLGLHLHDCEFRCCVIGLGSSYTAILTLTKNAPTPLVTIKWAVG